MRSTDPQRFGSVYARMKILWSIAPVKYARILERPWKSHGTIMRGLCGLAPINGLMGGGISRILLRCVA